MNKDLRKLKISLPVSEQTAIIGKPFDPIAQPAAILIFTGTFCAPCARMSPTYVQIAQQYPNVPAVAISQEGPSRLSHYYDKVKNFINYSISSVPPDTWDTLANELGVDGIPHCVVLAEGKVIFNGHPAQPEYIKIIKTLSEAVAKATASK